MTVGLIELKRVSRGGDIETLTFGPGVTVITGPRNSGKTTILRMIDYCFGSDESPHIHLGQTVVDAYTRIELGLTLSGVEHNLVRFLDREHGLTSKVYADGEALDPSQISSWIMSRLGWPQLSIPKGLIATTAREEVPLTFRALLRHLYRKEDSWTEFATKEHEYLRRAVLAFFLGLATGRYSGAEYRVGEAIRRVEQLEAVEREVTASTNEAAVEIIRSLGLETGPTPAIDSLATMLDLEAAELNVTRAAIATELRALPQYGADLDVQLAALTAERTVLAQTVQQMEAVQAGYTDARRLARAELDRLQRAADSLAAFDDLPVTKCPACAQAISASRRRSADPSVCYVCAQPVTPDARRERADVERRAVEDELIELDEVSTRTAVELDRTRSRLLGMTAEAEALGVQIDRQRAATLAPYVSQLESIAMRLGEIKRQSGALQGLRVLDRRQRRAREELARAQQGLDIARSEAARVLVSERDAATRCAGLANRMNEFLGSLKTDPWQLGSVAVTTDALQFYSGVLPWDQMLGGESRVLFFFAYEFALLHVGLDVGAGAVAPGFVLLDNPIQQGLPDIVIREVLDRFAEGCERTKGQVIATVARPVLPSADHERIALITRFGESDVAV